MHRTHRAIAGALAAGMGLVLALVAPALACAPLATVTLSSPTAPSGTEVRITGRGFYNQAPIELSWRNQVSQALTTATGPNFSVTVSIPPADPGVYPVVALQRSPTGHLVQATTMFEVTPPPPASGYWMAAADGGIFAFGDAGFFGSTGGISLDKPIVGMAATPSGKGYWLVGEDGGIFAFGDAGFFGSAGGASVLRPIVGMAAATLGAGYLLVATHGEVLPFGQTGSLGSRPGSPATSRIVGMAPTGSGRGSWLVDSGGGIVAHGEAELLGSTAGLALAKPAVGVAASGSTRGYWLTASDGGVFAFGDAAFFGSTGGIALHQPIVGMTATRPPQPPPPPPPPGPPECRNSTDPTCGEFRWDPPPAPNQPLVASFTTAPTNAIVGQQVTFEVSWTDGDAPLVESSSFGSRVVVCAPLPPAFGPWTTPERVPSGGTLRFTRTYTQAGTYREIGVLRTGVLCGLSPYGDSELVETTIVVTAPPRG